ncbi:MAG: glycosyltransferase family 2 protein, partial [Acidimicrobiales bacterium]
VGPDGAEQRAWWPFPSPAATWAEALGLHLLRRRPEDGRRGFVVGACLLVRRAAFEAVGGFDERFWLYGEEADLCRRFWAAGWSVRHVPEAVATHVGGASGDGPGGVAFEHFQRGAEHYIAKHHGGAALVVHRLGLLVGSALRLPALALRPGDPRIGRRWRMARRLARHLATHPTRVEEVR